MDKGTTHDAQLLNMVLVEFSLSIVKTPFFLSLNHQFIIITNIFFLTAKTNLLLPLEKKSHTKKKQIQMLGYITNIFLTIKLQ